MHALRHIRQYVSQDATLTVANALVGSNLDYCYFCRSLSVLTLTYNIWMSQSDGVMLDIPQFVPYVYKSPMQFGFSFAYDALWCRLSMHLIYDFFIGVIGCCSLESVFMMEIRWYKVGLDSCGRLPFSGLQRVGEIRMILLANQISLIKSWHLL